MKIFKIHPVGSGLTWCFVLFALVLVGAVDALAHGVTAGDKGYIQEISGVNWPRQEIGQRGDGTDFVERIPQDADEQLDRREQLKAAGYTILTPCILLRFVLAMIDHPRAN